MIVTGLLIWLLIGSLVWIVSDQVVDIGKVYQAHQAEDSKVSGLTLVLGSIVAIVAWPMIARALFSRGPSIVFRKVARNLWGKPSPDPGGFTPPKPDRRDRGFVLLDLLVPSSLVLAIVLLAVVIVKTADVCTAESPHGPRVGGILVGGCK